MRRARTLLAAAAILVVPANAALADNLAAIGDILAFSTDVSFTCDQVAAGGEAGASRQGLMRLQYEGTRHYAQGSDVVITAEPSSPYLAVSPSSHTLNVGTWGDPVSTVQYAILTTVHRGIQPGAHHVAATAVGVDEDGAEYVLQATWLVHVSGTTCPEPPDEPEPEDEVYFGAFAQPVVDGALVARAGQAVALRWAVHDDEALTDGIAGAVDQQTVVHRQVPCDDEDVDGGEEVAEAAGASGLRWDEADQHYAFVWRTDRAWAGTCRAVTVTFDDGERTGAGEVVVHFRR